MIDDLDRDLCLVFEVFRLRSYRHAKGNRRTTLPPSPRTKKKNRNTHEQERLRVPPFKKPRQLRLVPQEVGPYIAPSSPPNQRRYREIKHVRRVDGADKRPGSSSGATPGRIQYRRYSIGIYRAVLVLPVQCWYCTYQAECYNIRIACTVLQ